MSETTPQEILLNTISLTTHLEAAGVYDEVVRSMEQYAAQFKGRETPTSPSN